MDPVQALIIKLMEGNAQRPPPGGNIQPPQPQPGGAQPNPDDLIAQLLQRRG
jgi:hypothetical protein